MTIRLYDSRSGTQRMLEPVVEGRVSIYVCGPTVQSSPHVGHLRSALVYDLWRRWLTYRGLAVTLVRNVTDIDDKILAASNGTDEEWWALAYRVELEFSAQYALLGIAPPTYEPRATASVQQMQTLIGELIERGHAYAAEDDSGDVYFDTGSWPAYGELTHQNPADMAAATDADPRGKRDPRDFALWKGLKAHEPASAQWPSPWGPGRPGWHIECSAMSSRYLGDRFDIHGGGLDLRFPHHENELAQSSAAGRPFADHWVHNGLVSVDGQKMSKSLGNSIFASDLIASSSPLAVRYWLGSAHYRSTIDYHDGSLAEAEAALDRIAGFLRRAERRLGAAAPTETDDPPAEFASAMDDDLAVPQALAVLHDRVRAGNTALDIEDLDPAATIRREVVAMVRLLGIDPLSPEWQKPDSREADALDALVRALMVQRAEARVSRDFAASDRIRTQLAAVGVQLEDTPSGSDWRLS